MIPLNTKWAVVVVLGLGLRTVGQTSAGASDNSSQQGTPPVPAYGQANPSVMSGQNPPISALDAPSLEPNLQPRSMLVGGVVASESLDTNVNQTPGASTDFHSVTRLFGGLTMQRVWERYNFGAAYIGGAGFYPSASPLVRNIQEVQAQQSVLWKTGQATIRDSFSYLPEGSFGAGAYGGASGFQLGLGGLDQYGGLTGGSLGGHYGIVGAGQFGSLGQSPRINNVAIVDVIEELTPRSAITAAGSFGVIHFTDSNPDGFINSNQFGGDVGYNYALTLHDQVGAAYGFRAFRYPSGIGASGVDSHVFQGLYGHRISGRMDFIVGAGPQVTIIHGTSTTTEGQSTGSSTRVTASARASLRYRFQRAEASVSYLRIDTTGSGFFAGAEADIVRLSGSYEIARRWHARVDAGYSHNDRLQSLPAVPGQPTGVNAGAFDYIFAGAGLEREFNRNLAAFVSYQFNTQVFSDLQCNGLGNSQSCNNRTSRQVVQFGASWHFRPIRLD